MDAETAVTTAGGGAVGTALLIQIWRMFREGKSQDGAESRLNKFTDGLLARVEALEIHNNELQAKLLEAAQLIGQLKAELAALKGEAE